MNDSTPSDRHQSEAETDRPAPNRDQAAANRDSAAADRDQSASGRDQSEVATDQRTSNRELAAADREDAAADRAAAARDREYALTALEVQRDAIDMLVNELETSRRAHIRRSATLAHEVRTPLHAIRGLTEGLLAKPGAVAGETATDLRVVDEAAVQALELVNQELVLCTLDAGRAVVRLDDVSVPSLLTPLKAMMEPLRLSANVEFVVESAAADLPTLRSDPGKIAQILRNLVSNALRHTESGEVRVSAALAQGGRLVEFTVRDTGPGLRPEDRSRIFEDFEQVNAAASGSGRGLGLPLAARLARLLGGDVTLDAAGGGACFRASVAVTFDPAQAGPAVEVLPPPEPAGAQPATPGDAAANAAAAERAHRFARPR